MRGARRSTLSKERYAKTESASREGAFCSADGQLSHIYGEAEKADWNKQNTPTQGTECFRGLSLKAHMSRERCKDSINTYEKDSL